MVAYSGSPSRLWRLLRSLVPKTACQVEISEQSVGRPTSDRRLRQRTAAFSGLHERPPIHTTAVRDHFPSSALVRIKPARCPIDPWRLAPETPARVVSRTALNANGADTARTGPLTGRSTSNAFADAGRPSLLPPVGAQF